MPSSSQVGRPRLNKQSSSSSQLAGNRNIRDFFKTFTIPKNRIPANNVVEEEIVVASPQRPSSASRSSSPLSPPVKSQRSVKRGKDSKASSGVATSTKKSRSPVKPRHVPQLDRTDDDVGLHHESPSGSQQRVVAAVQILSSTNAKQTNDSNANMANTSFNSTSSLTTLPLSSQASSSRRIVKDGVPAVTNSDSGSADDSDDELLDIVTKPRKRIKVTPPPGADVETAIEIPSTVKPLVRQSGRLSGKTSYGSSRSDTPRRRHSPEPRPPANTSSLLKLVREKEKREKAEANIREAETAFEEEQRRKEEKLRVQRDLGGGIKALVADDSDEGKRMMLAMERTEAMADEEELFYFRGVKEDLDSSVKEPTASDVAAFAAWAGKRFERLKRMVLDPTARDQACLTGFLADIATKTGLPTKLTDWMFGRLVHETREELCEAYIEILRRCLERADASHARYASLQTLYRTLDPGSEREGEDMSPRNHSLRTDCALPGLRLVLRVVQQASVAGPHVHVMETFCELALANVDPRVRSDASLRAQLQESLTALIPTLLSNLRERHPEEDAAFKVWTLWLGMLPIPLPMFCRLIASLPAHDKHCHGLRRELALYTITNRHQAEPTHVVRPDQSKDWSTLLLAALKTSPDWSIAETTHYVHLNALIPVLDIALDAGFPVDVPTNPTTFPTKASTSLFGPSTNARTTQSNEEKAFNKQIDAFVDQLRAIASRIRDAGTSHLRRTEAKSALERVVVRLEGCRTRERERMGVFGGVGRQKGLEGFLGKGGEGVQGGGGLLGGTNKGEDNEGGEEEGRKTEGVGERPGSRIKQARKRKWEWKGRGDTEDRVQVIPEDRLSDREGDSDAEQEVGGGADEEVDGQQGAGNDEF